MGIRYRLAGGGAASTTHAVPLSDAQGGKVAKVGDRVVVGFTNDQATTVATASTGWTSLGSDTQGTTTNIRLTLWTRVLDGGANDALTVTLTDGTNSPIQEAQWDVICAVGNGGTPVGSAANTAVFNNAGGNTGATGTATVGAISGLAAGNWDSLIFLGIDNSDGEQHPIPATPTGWANLTPSTTPPAADPVVCYSTDRTGSNVTGFTPGDIVFTNQEQWVSAHIALPAATETRRFYLPNAAPDWSPGAASGFWNDSATGLAVPHALTEAPAGAGASTAVAETSADAAWWVLLGQWTSLPATAAGTIAGAFWIAAAWLESNADAEFRPVVTVYVLIGETTTRRGTPINLFNSARELPAGTAAGVEYTMSGPIAVDFQPGDRIVVELGYRAHNTHTTSRTGTLYYGGTGSPPMADGVTDLNRPGWIDLTLTPGVLFEEPGGIDVPLGRPTSAEVARPLAVSKSVTLGRPATVEVARPVEAVQGFGLSRPTSVEVARPLRVSKSVTLGRPATVEVARPLDVEEPAGVGFLLDELGGAARILVQVAWGADLGADWSSWTWTDITRDVRAEPGISTSLGRADEASTSQPANCTLQLTNTSSAYSTGGHSPNWPNVRRNVPVRIRIDPDGNGFHDVFFGFADGFTPGWDSMTGRIPVVTLSASGALRRLQQGDKPVVSAYRRAMIATPSVVAYWPFEDGKNASYAKNVRGGSDMVAANGGSHEFDSPNNFDCSGPLVRLRSTPEGTFEEFGAPVDPYTDTGETQVRWLMSIPRDGLPNGAFLADIYTSGSAARWSVTFAEDDVILPGGGLHFTVWDADNDVIQETFNIGFAVNGYDLRFSVELEQDGSDVTWRIGTIAPDDLGAGFFEGTVTGHTVGTVVSLFIGGNDVDDVIAGHVTIQNEITSLFEAAGPLQAHVGELPTAFPSGRFYRLTRDADVPFSAFGSGASLSVNDTMGPQLVKPLLELMRECEAADQGQLWDGLREPGLLYSTRRFRELGTVALTIDAGAGELAAPFDPVDDDQRTRNSVEATITTGITAVFEDVDGPLGTLAVGTYDAAVEANNEHDSMAVHYAAWHVHLGTVPGYRYPSVTIDLRAAPHLADAVLGIIPGERIDVVNLDDILDAFPTGTVSLIVEGIAHEITSTTWRVTFQCSPFSPWGIARVAAETGDTSAFAWRLDTDGAVLVGDHSAGATALTVTSDPIPVATDAFARTVVNGWGAADPGGTYELAGTAGAAVSDFDVAAGVGTIAIAATNRVEMAFLEELSVTDCDITARCSLPFSNVTGTGWLEVGNLMVRGTGFGDHIYAHVQVLASELVAIGIVQVVAGVSTTIGAHVTMPDLPFTGALQVRMQAEGRQLRARVWNPAGAEPDSWDVEATVDVATPGWVGLRAAVATGVTNTLPVTFSFDNLIVTTLDPPGGPPWTTVADDYPLTLDVGGIPVTATACTGVSSPQTFTVDPLPLARAAGMPVRLWDPRPVGL